MEKRGGQKTRLTPQLAQDGIQTGAPLRRLQVGFGIEHRLILLADRMEP